MKNAKVGINCLEMEHSVDVSQNKEETPAEKVEKLQRLNFKQLMSNSVNDLNQKNLSSLPTK